MRDSDQNLHKDHCLSAVLARRKARARRLPYLRRDRTCDAAAGSKATTHASPSASFRGIAPPLCSSVTCGASVQDGTGIGQGRSWRAQDSDDGCSSATSTRAERIEPTGCAARRSRPGLGRNEMVEARGSRPLCRTRASSSCARACPDRHRPVSIERSGGAMIVRVVACRAAGGVMELVPRQPGRFVGTGAARRTEANPHRHDRTSHVDPQADRKVARRGRMTHR
jgi:hypothetical protein